MTHDDRFNKLFDAGNLTLVMRVAQKKSINNRRNCP